MFYQGSYLNNTMANSAVRLSAHQQQADNHDHGYSYSHHQQPHHGSSVKRLQGIRGLAEQEKQHIYSFV